MIVVLDESTTLDVGGAAVRDGFATQAPRFVAGHSDQPPQPPASPPEPPRAPPSRSPPAAWALPGLFEALDDEEATLPGDPRAGAPLVAGPGKFGQTGCPGARGAR